MNSLLVLLLICTQAYGQDKQVQAVEKLFSIFDPVKTKKGKQVFTVDACKIPQKKLMELTLLRKPVKASFKFMKGCDVQGEVELQVTKPFPVHLKVRNLEKYTNVTFNSTLSVGTVDEGIGYKVELNDGNLSSSASSVLFRGFYHYIVSLGDSAKGPKSEAGEIFIDSIDGEKVSYKKLLGKGTTN